MIFVCVLQQVHHVLHEVLVIRIFLVFYCHVQGVSEDRDHVRSISSRHKLEGNAQILHELVFPLGGSFVNVNLIGDHDAGNAGAEGPHLFVPSLQVLVGNFSTCIKN